MATVSAPSTRPLHPLHAILLAFPFSLFLGALLSDITYWSTFQIQWANFASWLIAGGLLGGGLVVLWALIDLIRFRTRSNLRPMIYVVLLLTMWALGFVNSLVHAKDAWAAMPEGLYLSAVSTLLAFAAAWTGYSRFDLGAIK